MALPLFDYAPGGAPSTQGVAWFFYALVILGAWGVQAFYMKLANRTMSAETIFLYMTITGLALIPVALWMTDFTQPINYGWNGPWLAAITQILNSIGALSLVFAFRYGKAIVVSPLINAVAPAITVALSLIIYRTFPHRIVAIGETGLDYYRLGERTVADMAWQRERFSVHVHAALQTQLPLVIHTRNASDDTLALLRAEGQGAVGGVFHCFTETMAVAKAALDLGFYISFSGILTFKNAADLREVARYVPLDRCLIETDSPYLAPMPHRGKTNEPAFVVKTLEQLAAVKGVTPTEMATTTNANFFRLFDKIPRPPGFT